jgi:regulator of CtrA degradation
MSVESKTGSPIGASENTIPFGKKYTESEQFSVVFQEGMALVEATAAYLDGDGRADAKGLESQVSLAYATESMRLTTRLMQLASWLLIRRAVNEGEMTPEQAFEEQNKVKFQHMITNASEEAYAALPVRLRELNEASLSLHRRVMAIDKLLKSELDDNAGDAPKAIGDQMSRLTEAFGPMVETPPVETP